MEAINPLEEARRKLNLSVSDIWLRYFAVGGMSTELEIEAVLYGALLASEADRDLLSIALNERFSELGGDHPMPYSTDEDR